MPGIAIFEKMPYPINANQGLEFDLTTKDTQSTTLRNHKGKKVISILDSL